MYDYGLSSAHGSVINLYLDIGNNATTWYKI